MPRELAELLEEVRACAICAPFLPLGPRPVLSPKATARLIIIGQAPGARVHATGIPWNDPSGVRLRNWLNMTDNQFYNDPAIAIMPMGFCYPGRGRGGDLPPRVECAPRWHQPLLDQMRERRLILLIGDYAQRFYLPHVRQESLSDRVRGYRRFLPTYFPLPHPSPRNTKWISDRPWFASEVLPRLRIEVARAITG